MDKMKIPKIDYVQIVFKVPKEKIEEINQVALKMGFRSRTAYFWPLHQENLKKLNQA
jgi:hypothetical protein